MSGREIEAWGASRFSQLARRSANMFCRRFNCARAAHHSAPHFTSLRLCPWSCTHILHSRTPSWLELWFLFLFKKSFPFICLDASTVVIFILWFTDYCGCWVICVLEVSVCGVYMLYVLLNISSYFFCCLFFYLFGPAGFCLKINMYVNCQTSYN